MTNDLEARAARVRIVTEGNHGRVVDEDAEKITIEVPADISIGLGRLWGEGGFLPMFMGQTTRLAPRRVIAANDQIVVCPDDMVTTAYYIFEIDLTQDTHAGARPASGPAEITRPSPPFRG
jgi:hypothetical protein